MTKSYFDAKGIIDFYTKLGKTATADFFRSINEKDADIVRHGRITWIPESFVRRWCELSAVTPTHAEERFKEIQSYAIQWIPMGDESQEEVRRMYASIAAKNN